jgi:hypothetical protein
MKFLKVIVIALITVFAFADAQAQIRVKVGESPRRHRKVVVVERRVRHVPPRRHVVVVKQAPLRRHY